MKGVIKGFWAIAPLKFRFLGARLFTRWMVLVRGSIGFIRGVAVKAFM